jgi:hypothetical protein
LAIIHQGLTDGLAGLAGKTGYIYFIFYFLLKRKKVYRISELDPGNPAFPAKRKTNPVYLHYYKYEQIRIPNPRCAGKQAGAIAWPTSFSVRRV